MWLTNFFLQPFKPVWNIFWVNWASRPRDWKENPCTARRLIWVIPKSPLILLFRSLNPVFPVRPLPRSVGRWTNQALSQGLIAATEAEGISTVKDSLDSKTTQQKTRMSYESYKYPINRFCRLHVLGHARSEDLLSTKLCWAQPPSKMQIFNTKLPNVCVLQKMSPGPQTIAQQGDVRSISRLSRKQVSSWKFSCNVLVLAVVDGLPHWPSWNWIQTAKISSARVFRNGAHRVSDANISPLASGVLPGSKLFDRQRTLASSISDIKVTTCHFHMPAVS